jgi:hypothetical protein
MAQRIERRNDAEKFFHPWGRCGRGGDSHEKNGAEEFVDSAWLRAGAQAPDVAREVQISSWS